MKRRTIGFFVAGLAVALVLAFGVSRSASSEPDGLERVAADQALDRGEQPHALAAGPLADYSTRGVDDPGLATGFAGVVGVAATFVAAGGLVWVASRFSRRETTADGSTRAA
jgi:hypothetical protein